MARQLLVDSFSIRLNRLNENAAGGDKYTFEGKFGQCDVPTSNGRIYTRRLMEREIKRLEKKIAEGKVYGELDHPDDGKTKLQRSAVLIQSLAIDENGAVKGKAKILETSMGKELRAIVDGGGSIGVSSRGYGSVQANEDGFNEVQDDFKLMTYDPVSDPAEESAYPVVAGKQESSAQDNASPKKNEPKASDEDDEEDPDTVKDAPQGNVSTSEEKDYDEKDKEKEEKESDAEEEEAGEKAEKKDLKKAQKGDEKDHHAESLAVVSKALNEQKKTFKAELLVAIKEAEERVRKEVVSEMASDPSVAGSKAALDKVKSVLAPYVINEDSQQLIEVKDREIGNLQESLKVKDDELFEAKRRSAQMAKAAREMGFNLYLERSLSSHPKFKAIVESLGDFNKIESLDDLKSKVAVFVEQACQLGTEKDRHIASLVEKSELLREENIQIRTDLEETAQMALENSARVYLERKMTGNAKLVEARQVFEKLENKSKENVDQIIKDYRVQARNESRDFNSIRSRLQKAKGSVVSETMVEDHTKETFPKNQNGESFNLLDESFDMGEINRLAGV